MSRLPNPPEKYDQRWANELVRVLSQAGQSVYKSNGYTSTHTTNRTISTGVSTLAQTQDVLGTLIADLQKKGVI